MEDQSGLVPIAGQNLQCSFQVRNVGKPGLAASDTCRMPAESAVEYPDGSRMWPRQRHMRERWAEGTPHPFPPRTPRWGKVHLTMRLG